MAKNYYGPQLGFDTLRSETYQNLATVTRTLQSFLKSVFLHSL